MSEFAILLRGINVGAHNRIKMADLKAALEAEGLTEIQTYIQSGNVRAACSGDDEAVRKIVEAALQSRGIKKAEMAILSWKRLESLVRENPYKSYGDEWRKLALFLSAPLPNPQKLGGEYGVMKVIGAHKDVIYTLAKKEDTPGMKGMDNLEKIHKIPTTGRFWNVIEDWVVKQAG